MKFGVLKGVRLAWGYWLDGWRYARWSTTCRRPTTPLQFDSRITAHYHVLEKGLSMPSPRLGFGVEVATSLLDLIERYRSVFPERVSEPVEIALSVLFEYREFNRPRLIDTELGQRLDSVESASGFGGTHLLLRETLLENWAGDFATLASNRHSIRNFTGESVPRSLVNEVVDIARWTPSVCNRQAWNLISINDKETLSKALSLQNGNRGFGDTLGGLLIVWMNQECFHGVEERNQAWIDGGMFSMSLIHALCSKGLGSCPLNWCASHESDRVLRKLLKLPDSAVVVMYIGIGFVPEKLRVAKSRRRSVEEIVSRR